MSESKAEKKQPMFGYTFFEFSISPHMLAALRCYTEKHEPVGGFLTAVICNDLSEAVRRADEVNLRNLPAFVGYLYNKADSRCWGSKERMTAWLDMKKEIDP